MLSSIAKEHQAARTRHKALLAFKKQQMLTALGELTTTLPCHIDEKVSKAYHNQRRLNSDIKQLQESLQVHKRQVAGWVKLVGEFHKTLKELGDVENWACKMERETLILDGCLRLVLTHSPYVGPTGP
ncbi:hypothetical protein CRM22_002865 [Opisthorchis felineus]|uniref:Biogenesis of lysosome-related organelles complex 1 subunit 1 n=1 Tax=Opisthorchis felineus TaxID=147828 RepID=A0A4S2M3Z0_OPIFE|nr:hypothetical protein CRM22_002865 [Opisthorchis felineus]